MSARSYHAKKQQIGLVDSLAKKTHFSQEEVSSLLTIFKKLAQPQDKLDRVKFRNILHCTFDMTEDMLLDRVFKVFDKDNDSHISFEEWICGLSVFLRGTMEEKMSYCFMAYNLKGDGFITREEMYHLLKNCLVRHPIEDDPDEGVKELIELTLKKMDRDFDGKISFSDYKLAVQEEPLLLQAFGQCLPGKKESKSFQVTFVDFDESSSYRDI